MSGTIISWFHPKFTCYMCQQNLSMTASMQAWQQNNKPHMIITESPNLIRVTQSWSSISYSPEYSHHMYSSLTLQAYLLFSSTFYLFFKLIIVSNFINSSIIYCSFNIQHFLYFLPLPHGHGSLRPIFLPTTTVPDFFCSI